MHNKLSSPVQFDDIDPFRPAWWRRLPMPRTQGEFAFWWTGLLTFLLWLCWVTA